MMAPDNAAVLPVAPIMPRFTPMWTLIPAVIVPNIVATTLSTMIHLLRSATPVIMRLRACCGCQTETPHHQCDSGSKFEDRHHTLP
jgi:hypothetical protein